MKVGLEKVVFEAVKKNLHVIIWINHVVLWKGSCYQHNKYVVNVCLDKEVVQERRHLELWQVTSETSSTDVVVSRPWLSIGSRIPVLVLEASESEQDDTLIHGCD